MQHPANAQTAKVLKVQEASVLDKAADAALAANTGASQRFIRKTAEKISSGIATGVDKVVGGAIGLAKGSFIKVAKDSTGSFYDW
jgi:hypothetical protein